MSRSTVSSILAMGIALVCWASPSQAEWMWTPESGKWISEKSVEKKSAMLLYEEAQNKEQAGDIQKALDLYRKLIRQYPSSSIAPDAQYWVGHLMEEQGDYYRAFKEYQKVIENYPSYKKFNDILERQYQIGNLYLSGEKLKLMGFAILPAVDKSIEIFETIVRTAPYSPVAPRAQFNIGEAYRKIKRYAEAIPEYQKVLENYPDSDLAAEARYQIGQCSYQKTLNPNYDQTNTDVALDSMKTFVRKHQDSKKSVEMQQKIEELIRRKAQKSFDIAEFYNRSRADEAAIIYYQDVIDNYPQTDLAKISATKIDQIAARPSKKKYADAGKEVIQIEEKKGMLARLWPFGAKKDAAPKAEEKVEEVPAPKAEPQKAPGKKPFWAFWMREPKQTTRSPMVITDAYGKVLEPAETKAQGAVAQTATAAGAAAASAAVQAVQAAAAPIAETPPAPAAPKRLEDEWEEDLADAAPAPATSVPQASPAGAAQQAPQPQAQPIVLPMGPRIKTLQWEEKGNTMRLLFATNADLEFKTYYLKDPSRVLVSFTPGVVSMLQETINVNKGCVQTVRQHFRSKDAGAVGKPLNALVVDVEKSKEVKVFNEAGTFVIEVEKA